MSIILVILLFSLLIFVHELGHFIVSKLCGVKVEQFTIGFGPAIFKKQVGETLYSLRCIPIGGYCSMEGEDTDTDNPRSFQKAAWWKRLIILIAGAAMNFIAGLLIFIALFAPEETLVQPVISFAEGGLTNAVSASLHQTMISFAGQNYGAKKYSRIWKSLKYCVIYALVIGAIMGVFSYVFLDVWVPWFINNPTAEVMEFARIRALYLLRPCAISIMQGISTGTLRGLGYSLYPTFVTLFGVCIFRVVWIFWVFPKYKSFACVILNFPITYILIILFCSFGIFYAYRKLMNPKSGYAVSAG